MRLLDTFTYEHASTRDHAQPAPATVSTSRNSSSSAREWPGCVYYGGISQGTSDDSDTAARYAARFCPDVQPCVQRYRAPSSTKTMLSLTAGSVVVEHPDCARSPAFYLCDRANAEAATVHHPGTKHFMRVHKCGGLSITGS